MIRPVLHCVNKIIAKMDRYLSYTNHSKIYPAILESDEEIIGVFENEKDRVENAIIITNKGLHVCENDTSSRKIFYNEIIDHGYPESDKKRTEEILQLHLKNGESFPLFIKKRSEDQQTNDIYPWIRFLRQMQWNIEKETEKASLDNDTI